MDSHEYDPVVLVTGATGNLGARLAADILSRLPRSRVIALARASASGSAAERVHAAVRSAGSRLEAQALRRLVVVSGDLAQRRLGLSDPVYRKLAERVTHCIHAAATTQFHLPFTCAYSVNCTGTERMLAWAQQARECGSLASFAYVSTAYVCGNRQGLIRESELEARQCFANSYEETKFLAERVVAARTSTLPITIYRPSIVVGDSLTGAIGTLNVLYVPLELICKGVVSMLPGRADATLDIVPVDFVSQAIIRTSIESRRHQGRTLHLVAGPRHTVTVRELIDSALRCVHGPAHRSRLRYVSPDRWSAEAGASGSRYARRVMQLYAPYINARRWFDDTEATAALADSGLYAPPLSAYLNAILGYCSASGWGRGVRIAA